MVGKQNIKLTDKAFFRLITLSLLWILFTITCLCSATVAWYSTNVSSQQSVVESGVFDIDVSVADPHGEKLTVTKNVNGKSSCVFAEAGEYSVTVSVGESSTVESGFCLVKIGGESYATDLLSKETPSSFVVAIAEAEAGSTVVFTPNWGIPAMPDVVSGVLRRDL